MPRKAVCPKDNSHETFITVAYVSEDWVVDSEGNFLDIHHHCGQVLHKPDYDNRWTCLTCGTGAISICI